MMITVIMIMIINNNNNQSLITMAILLVSSKAPGIGDGLHYTKIKKNYYPNPISFPEGKYPS